MVAAEFRNATSTVRIHDEYCEKTVDQRISHLSRIISASYQRRQLIPAEQPSAEIAAANMTSGVLES